MNIFCKETIKNKEHEIRQRWNALQSSRLISKEDSTQRGPFLIRTQSKTQTPQSKIDKSRRHNPIRD